MRDTEPRLEPAREGFVGQERVQMHGCLGRAHAMALGRNGRVEIGQGLAVGKPCGLWNESFDELQHPVGAVDETIEELAGIETARVRSPLVEPALSAGYLLARREPDKGQVIRALEMRSRF